jgi:hypothetical protein
MFYATVVRKSMEATQSRIEWVEVVLLLGVKRSERISHQPVQSIVASKLGICGALELPQFLCMLFMVWRLDTGQLSF